MFYQNQGIFGQFNFNTWISSKTIFQKLRKHLSTKAYFHCFCFEILNRTWYLGKGIGNTPNGHMMQKIDEVGSVRLNLTKFELEFC